jgi:hypothetical protein
MTRVAVAVLVGGSAVTDGVMVIAGLAGGWDGVEFTAGTCGDAQLARIEIRMMRVRLDAFFMAAFE